MATYYVDPVDGNNSWTGENRTNTSGDGPWRNIPGMGWNGSSFNSAYSPQTTLQANDIIEVKSFYILPK